MGRSNELPDVKALRGRWVRGGGVVVALVGFGVTRLFVADTLGASDPLAVLLAGLVALVVGLGLTVYGVVLAVGAFSRRYVRTVTRWCLLGTGAMLIVLVLSSGESIFRGEGFRVLGESSALVANVLLGGAVAGVLVGSRSARNASQRRELRRRANQARLVNRLLRHEIINAAHVIDGHASLLDETGQDGDGFRADGDSLGAIRQSAARIVDTVEEIGDVITEYDGSDSVDLTAALAEEIRAVRDRFPEVTVRYEGPTGDVVRANSYRLDLVYRKLLEYAIEAAEASEVAVELTAADTEVVLTVAHDGTPFTDVQRTLLTDRKFPAYDDPTLGFRLQIVRLLVTRAGGRIEVIDENSLGPTVVVTLPRDETYASVTGAVELAGATLGRTVVAGLVAGVAMGAYVSLTSDTMVVIGALYGVENPLVGWTTHLFHSVVFAVLFAAAGTHEHLRRVVGDPLWSGAGGLVWGTVLWLVAAGIVMPLWLQLVGVPAMLPNVTVFGLVSHLLWGGVLGVTYAVLESYSLLEGQT